MTADLYSEFKLAVVDSLDIQMNLCITSDIENSIYDVDYNEYQQKVNGGYLN